MKNLFILFIFLQSINVNGQNSKDLVLYLDAINNYEFSTADSLATNFSSNKQLYINYVSILREDGQKHTYETYIIENIENENPQEQIFKNLLKARAQLSFLKQTENTASLLQSALTSATKINNKELTKRVLLEFLHFTRQDLKQHNNDYVFYLQKYKSLAETPIDLFYYWHYNFIFKSKEAEQDKFYYQEQFKPLQRASTRLKDNHNILPFFYFEEALINEINGDYENAFKLYHKVLTTSTKDDFYRDVNFGATMKISETLFKQDKIEEALTNLEHLKPLFNKNSLVVDSYYYNVYKAGYLKALDRNGDAYEALERSIELSDSLDQIQTIKQRTESLIEFNTKEKDQARIKNRNIALSLAAILIAVGVIGFLTLKNTKRKQRIAEQEREIEIQRTEKLLKDQELTAIDAMLEGQEKERQRLASDLHDSAGATLAAARMHYAHIKKYCNTNKEISQMANKTEELLNQAYQEVRTMAHLKKSGVIAKDGLLPAIKNLAYNASNASQLHIEVQDFGLTNRIENTLEISLFRIIQELITNIIKHAKASEASISITQHDNTLNVIVEDNGKGFQLQEINMDSGMGLSSIQQRVTHLNGTLDIDSYPGQGSTFIIDIPLEQTGLTI